MGGYTGKYSRNPFSMFNEEKNYALDDVKNFKDSRNS
jgi:hypothetical protein